MNELEYLGNDPRGKASTMSLVELVSRQREWSYYTFGPGPRVESLIDHIKKELVEIEENPKDVIEWIDVVLIALDGAWRSGHSPREVVDALIAKQEVNRKRDYPDWRISDNSKAVEHIR